MSRKKISTTVGIAPEVFERLLKEKARDPRNSFAYIVEAALRDRFKMPVEGEGENVNAD